METQKPTLTGIFEPLKYTFVIVPIVAGADKFANVLTRWDKYLNPAIADLLPFSAATFMMIVGVIEIIAGVIVLVKAKVGGYIVAAWLTAIAITLLAGMEYLDVAVRDLVMAMAALSMARLAKIVE